jgi:hypothetical protein
MECELKIPFCKKCSVGVLGWFCKYIKRPFGAHQSVVVYPISFVTISTLSPYWIAVLIVFPS